MASSITARRKRAPRTGRGTSAIPPTIAVLGAGTMGRAIACGIVRAGVAVARDLRICDRVPQVAAALARDLEGSTVVNRAADACRGATLVLLCVKPRDAIPLVAELARAGVLRRELVLVSIAAGVSIAALERAAKHNGKHKGKHNGKHGAAVVRVMPNTPCLIGKGLSVVAGGRRATERHLAQARAAFESLGRCMTLEEKHFDAVTAVSASGAAFVFVAMDALMDGGVACGLPRAAATTMVAQMTLGAAEMVLGTGRHPAALRDEIATPGGCTIRGLLVLEDGRLRATMARAVEATACAAAGLAAK
jgi:pyrroline-5-carboxylate reductase